MVPAPMVSGPFSRLRRASRVLSLCSCTHLCSGPYVDCTVRCQWRVGEGEREGDRTRRGEDGSDGYPGMLWHTLNTIDSKGRVRAQVRACVSKGCTCRGRTHGGR
jgi:hypothetical protein